MKNLLLASTSTLHGQDYLEYLLPKLKEHFSGCKQILFIPFARPGGISHEEYTNLAAKAFKNIGINIKGIHEFEDPADAVLKCRRHLYRRRQHFSARAAALCLQPVIYPSKGHF